MEGGGCYIRINSTESTASGAGDVSEPRLMSQVGRVRVGQGVPAVSALEVPVFVCIRNDCNHVTEVGGSQDLWTRGVCCHAK